MYRTISVQNDTYQQLNAIAARLDKPKAQVVAGLVKKYVESIEDVEKKKLDAHNTLMDQLAERITFPPGTKINTEDLDKDFEAVKDLEI